MFITLTKKRGNGWGFAGLSVPHLQRGQGSSPPSYVRVSILHMLSFLLNGSSILSNNPLQSGKHMIYGSSAERNELQSQWMNQRNPKERRSCDQLHGTHFLKWHFYCISLCAWLHWGFKESGSRQILDCFKKNSKTMEVFNVDLPPLTSFISVVSIQISCHSYKNLCDSLYKTWDRTTSGAFPSQIHLWHEAILTGHFSWKISRGVKFYLLKFCPFSHNISPNV